MVSDGSDLQPSSSRGRLDLSPGVFEMFRSLVYRSSGIHLAENKIQLVRSRLLKRILQLRLPSYRAYYEYMTRGPGRETGELTRMIDAITTNKTSFFREVEHFKLLRSVMENEWRLETEVRILSAGCSTGEEPYTMAMVAQEAFGPAAGVKVRIHAGDLSTEALTAAKRGVYPTERVREVPPDVIRRYFLKGTGKYRDQVKVSPVLQNMVVFHHLNLMNPLPFNYNFHAIFCRNVVIYFDRQTQARLFRRFHDKLVERGILFLGNSESLILFDMPFLPVMASAYRKQ